MTTSLFVHGLRIKFDPTLATLATLATLGFTAAQISLQAALQASVILAYPLSTKHRSPFELCRLRWLREVK